jgi:putative ABC transport system ATP-binding protein
MVAGPTTVGSHKGADIHTQALTRRYRVDTDTVITGVAEVSLHVDAGSIVALTGPSGSGKSTFLHLLGAIDRPDSGTITVDGVDLAGLSRRQLARYRRGTGFVFQRFNLLPALTALDNVVAPAIPYRTPFDKRERAAELLCQVGLAGRAGSLPSRLSGGQQQRVAIARALIGMPRLLLADEPTGNLDSATGAGILDLLVGLRDQHGMTIIVATHDPGVAARADRVVRLRDGGVIDDTLVTPTTPPNELLRRINELRP